jgi:uncharacterized hydrophobic protein (TIGR00271 family)
MPPGGRIGPERVFARRFAQDLALERQNPAPSLHVILHRARPSTLGAVVHLRIVAPREHAERALRRLQGTDSVVNVVVLRDAALKPKGDVILADVAREDASVVLADLRHLGIDECGSISVDTIDTQLSKASVDAERAASGAPGDAVIWEEVAHRTSEESTLSGTFIAFMVLAMLIVAVGILLDSAILIVGGMIVGPEFGPIAAFCVAVVQRRGPLAFRSLAALLVGFPVAIVVTVFAVWLMKGIGAAPETFSTEAHSFSRTIANPDLLAFFVAFCAGVAGMLSLTTAKSGALIGVLISVTTIPAAANVAVAIVYGDWSSARGSLEQLLLNVAGIHLAGVATLTIQRTLYARRRRLHRARMAARGLD